MLISCPECNEKVSDKALELDQHYVRAWLNKGNNLNRLGRYEEALRCFDKALAGPAQNTTETEHANERLRELSRQETAPAE